jgi:hypothetical protein
VKEMADLLVAKRGALPVGKHWTDRFVARRSELCTRFSRRYDYQRAKQEDPVVLGAWFRLVASMRAKYGIVDSDFYNFDETGFQMGMIKAGMVITRADRIAKPKAVQPGNREWATAICSVAADGHVVPPFLCVAGRFHLAAWYSDGQIPGNWVVRTTKTGWTDNATGLEWLKHFDQHTRARQKGQWRMLVLDGHGSHTNAEFSEYCEENGIVPLCLPSHSSHKTQPLDVGVFGPLKTAYGTQISNLARAHITHVTKDDFFPAFRAAFEATFTEQNVKGGFRGAGLVPLDPDAVIATRDVRFVTPPPPDGPPQPWVSQTPHTVAEALSQSALLRDEVARLQGSPTRAFKALDQMTKGTVGSFHDRSLLGHENKTLRKYGEIVSKRRRAPRTRLQDSGPLTGEQARQLLEENGVVEPEERDEGAEGGSTKRRCTSARLCGACRKPGHNARTCPDAANINSPSIPTS